VKIKFIKEYEGWPGQSVDYMATYDNGSSQRHTCSKNEWIVIETRELLLKAGADKDLLERFARAIKDVAQEDEWMSNVGEEL